MSAGPLRSTALVLRCATCAEPATVECARCLRPQCAEHTSTNDAELCSHCEDEWARFFDEPKALMEPTFTGRSAGFTTKFLLGSAVAAAIFSGITSGFEAFFVVLTLAVSFAGVCSVVLALGIARERELMHEEHRLLVEKRRDHKDTERKRFLAGAKAPPQLEAPEEQSKPSIPSFHNMLADK